jgi:uncharacterized protein (DUF433 family)
MSSHKIINRGRGPELAGTRFTVFDIIPFLKKGHETAAIAVACGLTVEQVKSLVAYIDEHKDEVMATNEQIEQRIARGNSAEVEAKLEASRGKARALREQLLHQERNGSRHPE